MRWADFAAAAPELAELGLQGFREASLAIIGTLRADGWPRISPSEAYVLEGELLFGMMRGSRKAVDLERDPRITVMTPQCDREASHGDFKLYGRAIPVTDPGLRERYADMLARQIQWRPTEPYPLFAVDVDTAAYISFGEGHRLLRWSADRGTEQLSHPDDVDTNRGVELASPSG